MEPNQGATTTNPCYLLERQERYAGRSRLVTNLGRADTLPMTEQAMRAVRDKPKHPIGFKPKRRRKK